MSVRLNVDMREKQKYELDLAHNQKRWVDMLEKVSLLIVEVNSKNEIIYVNPFFLSATGFDQEDLIGQNYKFIIPDRKKEEMRLLETNVENANDLTSYKNNIITKSGNELSVCWSIVAQFDENGNHINSISIGADITNENIAYEEIKHLKMQLENEILVLKAELSTSPNSSTIIGNSDAIKYVLQRALQVAPTETNVLLEGETGVGKELVTNYIQQNNVAGMLILPVSVSNYRNNFRTICNGGCHGLLKLQYME